MTEIKPSIRKADLIRGDTLCFRDARISDAEFILSLRTDVEKSQYLSSTSDDIEAQRIWLESYSKIKDQAYFIIEYCGESIGTVRLYDANGRSFSWGSWILKSGRPRHAAMESALMVYAYALDVLGFECAHFEVRKGNERVIAFHERFGAEQIGETDLEFLFSISNINLRKARKDYTEFLSGDVIVSDKISEIL